MHIFVGLGNPGSQYQNHRHNVGFQMVDYLFDYYHFRSWQKKFNAEYAENNIEGQKILLVKPQSFMNLSGQAIRQILQFYKLDLDNLTVIYDDLDLTPLKLRLKQGGGTGGHNGLKSIDAHCGKNYHKLRIGIGHPGHKDAVSSYVLSSFSKTEQEGLKDLLHKIAQYFPLYLNKEKELFLNKIHLKP